MGSLPSNGYPWLGEPKVAIEHYLPLLQSVTISENFLLFLSLCISGLPLLGPTVSFIKKCLQWLGLPAVTQATR